MRISSKSKIAFNVMLIVAAHSAKGYAIALPLVGKRLGISHSYLELIFSALKAAGLIRSFRGPGGGYSLCSKADQISLKDIVDAIEGEQGDIEGLSAQLWSDLDRFMRDQMTRISLAATLQNLEVPVESSLARLLRKAADHKKSGSPKEQIADAKKNGNNPGPNSIFNLAQHLMHN